MNTSSIALRSTRYVRIVSDFGETLVVRTQFGKKVLVDPVDETVTVAVPTGRRAKLIRFSFNGSACSRSRDSHVIVIRNNCRLGFASLVQPQLRVFLQDLIEGQQVDVFPVAEPAAVYAALPRTMPVLFGTVAAQPLYAACAA
jgi:hypothetical protein